MKRLSSIFIAAALLLSFMSLSGSSFASSGTPPPPNSPKLNIPPPPATEEKSAPQKNAALTGAVHPELLSYRSFLISPGWGYTYCLNSTITPYSWVFASLTEVTSSLPHQPHPGAAHFIVGNVIPRNGYAWVYTHSDWNTSLPAWVNCYIATS
jgi:hypothetical protein